MFLGNAGSVEARRVGKPGPRQVESQRQRARPMASEVRQDNRYLAVGLAIQGPAVLPLHPDRMPALFHERQGFDDERARWVGKSPSNNRSKATPELPFVPGALAD